MKKGFGIVQSILTGQQYLLIIYIYIYIYIERERERDNNPIEQHPTMLTLMTGVFNDRPSKPRSTFVWNIEKVLNYLSKLPDNFVANKGIIINLLYSYI